MEPLFDKKIDGFSVIFHLVSYQSVGLSTLQSRATAGIVGAITNRRAALLAQPLGPIAIAGGDLLAGLFGLAGDQPVEQSGVQREQFTHGSDLGSGQRGGRPLGQTCGGQRGCGSGGGDGFVAGLRGAGGGGAVLGVTA